MTDAVDLSPLWSVLRVHGADATAFLHAQLTTDVKALPPDEAQLSAYLSPQGRVLAPLLLVPADTHWWVLLHPSLALPILTRLRLFVLRSKVVLESDDTVIVRGRTDEGGSVVTGNPLPLDAVSPPRVRWPGGRRLEIVARDTVAEAVDGTAADRWLAEDLRHAIPHVTAETSDRHLAQSLGLEALGAVSYQKGCYPGQEIVARAHYLGRVKRHLALLEGSRRPLPGTRLRSGERPAGEVLIAADPDSGAPAVVLAVLSTAAGSADPPTDIPGELHDDENGSYHPPAP